MRNVLVFLTTMLFAMSSFAGFQGINNTQSLGIFSAVQCDASMSCIDGGKGNMIVSKSGSVENRILATATTLTKIQCGSLVYNSAAVVIKLPLVTAAVIGCTFTFVTLNASNFDVNPDDLDRILVSTDATGDAIRNATLGNSITLRAVALNQWAPTSIQGTYTDIN